MKGKQLFIAATVAIGLSASAQAAILNWNAELLPENETSPVVLDGATPSGSATGTYDTDTNILSYSYIFSGMTSDPSAGHVHEGFEGSSGGVLILMFSNPDYDDPTLTLFNGDGSGAGSGTGTIADDKEELLLAGGTYINFHTEKNPAGEIRGQIIFDEPVITAPIPLPASLPLLASVVVGLGLIGRRRKG